MIILQPTTDSQTFNILLNVTKSQLPLTNVSFALRDAATDTTNSFTGSVAADGFTQDATVAFTGLVEGAKYELVVTHNNRVIGREVAFVTAQNLETYTIAEGQFVYFAGEQNRNHVIF